MSDDVRPLETGDAITHLKIGKVDLSLLGPRSAEERLEQCGDEDEIPFWAQIWDASIGIGGYLAALTDRRGPGRLLDLGCGIGPVGCIAAALGWDVVMTDYLPEPLEYAAWNLRINALTASIVRADWRSFPIAGAFDVVTGSDILYEPDLHPTLALLWEQFRHTGATIIAGDPGRPTALNFAAAREQEGWPIHLEIWNGREGTVAVYIFGDSYQ